ncbi:MAG: hypothetical protein MMC33_005230 [Icmadophila ericetorum]|nr:hypothetical protein [Icmadophila ericetorum]
MLPSISYSWRTLDPMISSIYTQPPSPKVEAAWNDLWTYGPTGIPDSALPLLNKSHSVHWLRHSPDTPKHGSQIKAFVEGYHRIHCLHLIRQYTYRHTYNFSAEHYYFWDQPPAQLLDHVEHCIENVRSAIKCNADVTPLLMEKIGRDMRVGLRKRAKCREWEGIKRWGGENTV